MIARWVSILFHPFVMVGVMASVAAASRQSAGRAVRNVAVVVLFTLVPIAVLMVRQVRHGKWENPDASNRAERPILYFTAGAALLAYLLIVSPDSGMRRGVGVTLGMMAACAVATRWVKVSLHMAFSTLTAITLALMRSPVGYALLLALPVIMWSRLTLRRHTGIEVALGTIIGAAASAAIYYL